MKNTILAKRYAKALFSVAKETNSFDEYAGSLNQMAQMFREVPAVQDALVNPLYPVEIRTKVMDALVGTMGASKIMTSFFGLVVRKKRAQVLPEIAEAFQGLVDEQRAVCQGVVTTAMEISPDLKDKIQATLEKMTGKKVIVQTVVDPSIIGGMVAKVGDLVLDGSIRSQLAGLRESIKGSE